MSFSCFVCIVYLALLLFVLYLFLYLHILKLYSCIFCVFHYLLLIGMPLVLIFLKDSFLIQVFDVLSYKFRLDLPRVLEVLYPEVSTGHWDLYVMFIYNALSLLSISGLHSFIVPSSMAKERYGAGIRKHILTKRHLLALVDFGEHLAFEGVSRHYLVYLVSIPSRPQKETRLYKYINGAFAEVGKINQEVFLDFWFI